MPVTQGESLRKNANEFVNYSKAGEEVTYGKLLFLNRIWIHGRFLGLLIKITFKDSIEEYVTSHNFICFYKIK